MAFALGIPFSLATIAALVSITNVAGHAIATTFDMAEGGLEHIKSGAAERLIRRATTVAEMLHMMSFDFITSSSGQAIIQTLVNCIEWARRYNKKSKLKQIFFSDAYKDRFLICNNSLSNYLSDMASLANISTFIRCQDGIGHSIQNKLVVE